MSRLFTRCAVAVAVLLAPASAVATPTFPIQLQGQTCYAGWMCLATTWTLYEDGSWADDWGTTGTWLFDEPNQRLGLRQVYDWDLDGVIDDEVRYVGNLVDGCVSGPVTSTYPAFCGMYPEGWDACPI